MGGFPTLSQLIDTLSFLGDQPAALGILVTALALVVLSDWRWSLLALIIQYVLAGWLLTQMLDPQMAMLRIMVSGIICLVLYITARQVNWSKNPSMGDATSSDDGPPPVRRILPTSVAFRLLIAVPAGLAILYATRSGSLTLPELPPHVNLAAVALMGMGLLSLGLTEEPLTAGMGLLTLMSGFELFYHSLEQAITIMGFLMGIDLLVALVTAYLTVARHLKTSESESQSTP